MKLDVVATAWVAFIVVVVSQVREAEAECKVPTTKPDFDVTRVSQRANPT